MTKICVPAPKALKGSLPSVVDLIEFSYKTHKKLVNIHNETLLLDYDWKTPEKLPSPDQLILSSHHFDTPPQDLRELLQQMKKRGPAKFYKIATFAHSLLDSLQMLLFVKNHPEVIGICMGPLGEITRILAPVFNIPLAYTPLSPEESTAPGQIPLSTLLEVYHYKKLSPQTSLYGLIGNPISQSPGHLYHNKIFQGRGVYVKMPLLKEELSSFFLLAPLLGFKGISVTAPLKEAVIPYLDTIEEQAKKMGAVNTVVWKEGKTHGYNTDGEGALLLLGDVQNKKILVLGTGGAARAVAYTAQKKGALVTIAGRDINKAKMLAKSFGCRGESIKTVSNDYEIFIQTTPAPFPVPSQVIVLDIALTPSSLPQEKITFSGMEMYIKQAELQQQIWDQWTGTSSDP